MNEPTYSSYLHKLHFVHSFTHSRIFIAPLRGNHSEGIPPQQGEKEQLAEDHKMCQKVFCGRGQGEQLKVSLQEDLSDSCRAHRTKYRSLCCLIYKSALQ